MMNMIDSESLTWPCAVAIVVSRFNELITKRLFAGAIERLRTCDIAEDQITAVWVPGAIEIPLIAQRLAVTNQFDVIIALGTVIRGETNHYDYVCQQVSNGCQQVALESEIPVIFGVLTTENEAQALARTGGEHGHKGIEAVDAALAMVSVLRQLDSQLTPRG